MRIEGPRGPNEVRKNEKTRKSGGTSSVFSSFLDGESEGAQAARASVPSAGIGNLLAVQGADDPAEGRTRKRMVARADRVLDALEDVHKGLLSGNLSTDTLGDVSRAVAERREKIEDPALLGLLDEVDLRAQVEMAKLEMARDAAMARRAAAAGNTPKNS